MRIEKTSESIKQQDNKESAQFISNKQISNIPMLCTNDNLPKVRHIDQDFKGSSDALGRVHRGSALRKVRLGAGFGSCMSSWTVDRRPPVGGQCAGWEMASWAGCPSWSPTRSRTEGSPRQSRLVGL